MADCLLLIADAAYYELVLLSPLKPVTDQA
jgi:hypothetical protein